MWYKLYRNLNLFNLFNFFLAYKLIFWNEKYQYENDNIKSK